MATELDEVKLAGMCLIKCLYLRGTNEPLLSQVGEADLPDVVGMDKDPFNRLGEEVLIFLGLGDKAVEDAKKNSEPTLNDTSTSSLPTDSAGPEVSTPSLNSSQATS